MAFPAGERIQMNALRSVDRTVPPPSGGRRDVVAAVLPWLVMVIASVLATFALLDGVTEHGDLARMDQPTLDWFIAHRTTVATAVLTGVSALGGEIVLPFLAVATAGALVWRRRRFEALLFVVALAAAETVSVVFKHAVGRPRPPVASMLGPHENGLSFPSGHTIGTATFAFVLAYLAWRARPTVMRLLSGLAIAGAAAMTMALSRLYLGDHWLTDVLASIALACGITALTAILGIALSRRTSSGVPVRPQAPADRAEPAP
jgi:membrane-associated phospholipid phosphatase